MRVPESKRVESGAKDDDLPNPSFNSFRQSIFRNPAARSGQQASDAGQGVCVRKLKHVTFDFTQNLHGKGVMEDSSHYRASGAQLVVERSSAPCDWVH